MLYANVLPDEDQRRNAQFRRSQEYTPPPAQCAQPEYLSPRELEILRLLVCGYGNAEIAAKLVPPITRGTVSNVVTDIMISLRVRSRTAAVTAAIKGGLVDVESIEVQER